MLFTVSGGCMKTLQAVLLCAAVALGTTLGLAQSGPPTSVKAALDKELSSLERHMVGLADAMPEDKYHFAPTAGKFDGVLDFAGQVNHVTGGINMYAASILGEKSQHGEDAGNAKQTKAQLMQGLKDAFVHAHKAIASLDDKTLFEPIPPPFGKDQTTRFSLAVAMVSHPNDHYGQMVEYLRGTGNVPPGSK
jgi:uncharacterized damage-inducible protein DinB